MIFASSGSVPPDNDAIRELRDTAKELNDTLQKEIKSTKRFSLAFMTLAFVQVIIAIGQLTVEALDPSQIWLRLFIMAACLIGIVIVFREGLKE